MADAGIKNKPLNRLTMLPEVALLGTPVKEKLSCFLCFILRERSSGPYFCAKLAKCFNIPTRLSLFFRFGNYFCLRVAISNYTVTNNPARRGKISIRNLRIHIHNLWICIRNLRLYVRNLRIENGPGRLGKHPGRRNTILRHFFPCTLQLYSHNLVTFARVFII